MPYTEIGYEVADGIATVTLNRPERMNAFTLTMRDELIDAFDRIDADDDVRAVVVTGAGRAFCAGADLSAAATPSTRQAGDAPASATSGRRHPARRRRHGRAAHRPLPQAGHRRVQRRRPSASASR